MTTKAMLGLARVTKAERRAAKNFVNTWDIEERRRWVGIRSHGKRGRKPNRY